MSVFKYLVGQPDPLYVAPRPVFDFPAELTVEAGANPFSIVTSSNFLQLSTWDAVQTQFEYNENLPLGRLWMCVTISTAYYFGIKALVYYMKDKKPVQHPGLKRFAQVHNYFLHLLSLLMLVQIVRHLFVAYQTYGYQQMIMDYGRVYQRGPLYFWYYIFYLSKFYEFIDTVLLALQKNKIITLHIYHHWATASLVIIEMAGYHPMQLVGITANCFIHVLMYFYYFLAVCDRKPSDRWSQIMTLCQITQFVLDIACLIQFAWLHFILGHPTSTSYTANTISIIVIASYLWLFIQMFGTKYGPEGKAKSYIRALIKKSGKSVFFKDIPDFFQPEVLILLAKAVDPRFDSSFDNTQVSQVYSKCVDVLESQGVSLTTGKEPISVRQLVEKSLSNDQVISIIHSCKKVAAGHKKKH